MEVVGAWSKFEVEQGGRCSKSSRSQEMEQRWLSQFALARECLNSTQKVVPTVRTCTGMPN